MRGVGRLGHLHTLESFASRLDSHVELSGRTESMSGQLAAEQDWPVAGARIVGAGVAGATSISIPGVPALIQISTIGSRGSQASAGKPQADRQARAGERHRLGRPAIRGQWQQLRVSVDAIVLRGAEAARVVVRDVATTVDLWSGAVYLPARSRRGYCW